MFTRGYHLPIGWNNPATFHREFTAGILDTLLVKSLKCWWKKSGVCGLNDKLTIGEFPFISIHTHSYPFIVIHIWLVVSAILKNISQWEGLSHILWKVKNVPNHQPDIYNIYIYTYTKLHEYPFTFMKICSFPHWCLHLDLKEPPKEPPKFAHGPHHLGRSSYPSPGNGAVVVRFFNIYQQNWVKKNGDLLLLHSIHMY